MGKDNIGKINSYSASSNNFNMSNYSSNPNNVTQKYSKVQSYDIEEIDYSNVEEEIENNQQMIYQDNFVGPLPPGARYEGTTEYGQKYNQIQTIKDNQKLLEDLIKELEGQIGESKTIEQLLNDLSSVNPSVAQLFPKCLYTVIPENGGFEAILELLKVLGYETENISYEQYVKNVENGKYFNLMTGASISSYNSQNINDVIKNMGYLLAGENLYNEIQMLEGNMEMPEEEYKKYSYIDEFFRKNINFEDVFGEKTITEGNYNSLRGKYAYYAMKLGYTVDISGNEYKINYNGEEIELPNEDLNSFFDTLEQKYYEKIFRDNGCDYNKLKQELSSYTVEINNKKITETEYREKVASSIFNSVAKSNGTQITSIEQFKNTDTTYGNITYYEFMKKLTSEHSENALKVVDQAAIAKAIEKDFFDKKITALNEEQAKIQANINSLKEANKQYGNQQKYLELSLLWVGEDLTEYETKIIDNNNSKYLEYLEQMTEEEKQEFHYLYYKYGEAKAREYFTTKEDEWNNRIGMARAAEWYEKYIESGNKAFTEQDLHFLWEIGFSDDAIKVLEDLDDIPDVAVKGLGEGVEGFFEGIFNNVFADGKKSVNDYERMYLSLMLSGDSDVLGHAYQISTSMGNMLPSMATSALVSLTTHNPALGAKVGSILMGLSSAGNTFESALQEGQDYWQSRIYGCMSGLSETTLGYFLGGIPGLSKLDEIPGVKGFVTRMLSEGLEESTQTVVDSYMRGFIFGETVEINWDEVLQSGIYGIITAGIMNGGSAVINGVKTDISNISNETIETIKAAEDVGVKVDYSKVMNPTTRASYINYLKNNNVASILNATRIDEFYKKINSDPSMEYFPKEKYSLLNSKYTGIGLSGRGVEWEQIPLEIRDKLIPDPNTVFGYRTKGAWKEHDWTDIENVLINRRNREIYFDLDDELVENIDRRLKNGEPLEDVARYAVEQRNKNKIKARTDMTPRGRAAVALRNVCKYGLFKDENIAKEITSELMKELVDVPDDEIYNKAMELVASKYNIELDLANERAIGPDFDSAYDSVQKKLRNNGLNSDRESVLRTLLEDSSRTNAELNILLGLNY